MLWIVAWALVPWLNAVANLLLGSGERSAIWEQSHALVVLNYAALSVAVVITLWGTDQIARRLETLRAATSRVLEGGVSEPFRELNNVVVPLVGAGATATAFAISTLLEDGWTPATLRGATWFILGIPIWAFLWTYASLQLGLDRGAPPDGQQSAETLSATHVFDLSQRPESSEYPHGVS